MALEWGKIFLVTVFSEAFLLTLVKIQDCLVKVINILVDEKILCLSKLKALVDILTDMTPRTELLLGWFEISFSFLLQICTIQKPIENVTYF